MSSLATAPLNIEAAVTETSANQAVAYEAVAYEASAGLTASPKTLSPWLFYDEAGSALFERITQLPEYYLTRAERAIFAAHADEILELAADGRCLTMAELGAGTAAKTGILLRAALRRQSRVIYQPIDVAESSLIEARDNIECHIPGVTVVPQCANYITEAVSIVRPRNARILALYIGSSIGNFTPPQAREVLSKLRRHLAPGDSLLLGTDLAPSANKNEAALLAAYDDSAGVTAAFNLNVLTRLNRELGAAFDLARFQHRAVWNARESRIEMHLESLCDQSVSIPGNAAAAAIDLFFAEGETIHTENSYKFTAAGVEALLRDSGFAITKIFADSQGLFSVTLATAD